MLALYPRPESNRHPLRDHILSVARLPISPRGYFGVSHFATVLRLNVLSYENII